MRKNKKAIAPLVATVLLIVIVIAAAGIIWAVVRGLIEPAVETGCFDTVGMTIDESWTCWDTEGTQGDEYNLTQFKISRDSKEYDLLDISVRLTYGGGSSIVKRLNKDFGKTVPQTPLEETVYKIKYSEWGINEYDEVTSIDIAPVIRIGEKESSCEIIDSAPMDPCALY
jgi:flagellin-like protein